jgi:hypothetical protein
MHIIAVECLGAIVLSWSPGMLKNGTDNGSGAHAYHGWRRKSVFGLFPTVAKLEFLNKSIGRLFSTIWGVNFQPPKDFRPFFPVRYTHRYHVCFGADFVVGRWKKSLTAG